MTIGRILAQTIDNEPAEQLRKRIESQQVGVSDNNLTEQLRQRIEGRQAPVSDDDLAEQLQQRIEGKETEAPIEKAIPDKILIKQMSGKMPGLKYEPSGRLMIGERGLPIGKEAIIVEQRRQKAFDELLKRGFKPEQIKLILGVEKELKPGLWQTFKPRIGQTVGGVAGGVLGPMWLAALAEPTPFGEIGAAAATAGILGAGGKAAQVGIEEKRLARPMELLRAGGEEALYEAGGRIGAKGLKLLFSPLIKKTIPEAASLVDDYAKVGGHFTPAQLDKRLSIKAGEAVSRGAFGGQQIFQEFAEKEIQSVTGFADEIVDSIAKGVSRKTPTEVGELFVESIQRPRGRIFQMMDDLFEPLYRKVDELTGMVTVSTKGLKSFALKELAQDQRLNRQYLSGIGRAKLTRIIGMDDAISFSDMRVLRSGYLKDVRKLARDVDKAESIIKRVASIADNAMFDPAAAKRLTPEASNLLRNTNRLYKTSQQVLQETFPGKLAKRIAANPAKVIKEIFPSKNVKAIHQTKLALTQTIKGQTDTEGTILWNQLRQAWLADAVEGATRQGKLKATTLDITFRRMGDDALKEMFSPDELSRIRKIPELFKVIARPTAAGTPLFTKGIQISGVYMMYRGAKEDDVLGLTAGGVLVFGPVAFAKLAVHPQGSKLLRAGLKMRLRSTELGPTIARMVKILYETNAKEAKLQQAIEKQKREVKFRESMPTLKEQRGFGGRGF